MNQMELTRRVAEKTGMYLCDAERAVRAVKESLIEGLLEDRSVKLKGVGTLEVVERKEKLGRDPNTRERMIFPAHYSAKMRCGEELRKKINDRIGKEEQ